jgi:hypothetical protein
MVMGMGMERMVMMMMMRKCSDSIQAWQGGRRGVSRNMICIVLDELSMECSMSYLVLSCSALFGLNKLREKKKEQERERKCRIDSV